MRGVPDHLRAALGWTRTVPVDWVMVAAGSFGMAIPVMVASFWGVPEPGLIAALGSLLVGRMETGHSFAQQIRHQGHMLSVAALAAGGGLLMTGPGWACDLEMILLAGIAALLGGIDRHFALATARFVIFLLILRNLADHAADPIARFGLLATGAVLTCALALVMAGTVRLIRGSTAIDPPPDPHKTRHQRLGRIAALLAEPAAWQFPIRLALALGLASLVRFFWPDHHAVWIALTIALVARRDLEILPIHVTQRVLGSMIGVAASGLFTLFAMPVGWLGLVVGVLSALRLWLNQRNYLAYSIVMTPLVIVLLDGGLAVQPGLLWDRLVATVIGGAIVIAVNGLFIAAARPRL